MRKKTSMGSGGQAPRTNTTGMGKGTEPGKPLRSLKSALASTRWSDAVRPPRARRCSSARPWGSRRPGARSRAACRPVAVGWQPPAARPSRRCTSCWPAPRLQWSTARWRWPAGAGQTGVELVQFIGLRHIEVQVRAAGRRLQTGIAVTAGADGDHDDAFGLGPRGRRGARIRRRPPCCSRRSARSWPAARRACWTPSPGVATSIARLMLVWPVGDRASMRVFTAAPLLVNGLWTPASWLNATRPTRDCVRSMASMKAFAARLAFPILFLSSMEAEMSRTSMTSTGDTSWDNWRSSSR